MAFTLDGNPTGRQPEKRGKETRYRYVGPASVVMTAAMYLLNAVVNETRTREILLFEGFASFKPRGSKSSHARDVIRLRNAVWSSAGAHAIGAADDLRLVATDRLASAFAVAGMDFGVPPVVVVDG